MPDTVNLPPSLLTKQQYDQQKMAEKYSVEKDLGRDAFLKLFTTQLTNQNPLEPMDNEAFVAQLAQFSSLESMKAMQASIENMSSLLQAEKFVSGSNLLGRAVGNPQGLVLAGTGEPARASVQLDNGAEEVLVRVFDGDGAQVYLRTFGPQSPGDMKLSWSGQDEDGNQLPPGIYQFVVAARVGGKLMPAPVTTLDRIQSVLWDSAAGDYKVETETGQVLNSKQITRVEL